MQRVREGWDDHLEQKTGPAQARPARPRQSDALVNRIAQIFETWKQAVALLRKACPRLSLAVALLTLLEAAANIAALYAMKLLVDEISPAVGGSKADGVGAIMPTLIVTAGALVGMVIVQNIANMLRLRQGLLVSEYVDRQIHDRAISVDLQFYESPLYHDALERARAGGAQRPAQVISSLISAVRAAIELLAVLALMARIDLRLLPVLVIPVSLALIARLHYTRKLFNWRMSRAQNERRAGYFDWLLTSATYAKEMRLAGLGGFFRDRYHTLKSQLRTDQIRIEQQKAWSELAIALLGALVFVAAGALLLQDSLAGTRPLGDVVLFLLLLRRAEGAGNEMVGGASRIVDDHMYMQRLFEFLGITPTLETSTGKLPPPASGGDSIKLTNVSFRYSPDGPDVLHDVSLELQRGKVVALVGENGSGKTTLIKLLTRLYDPTSGVVLLDGTDIRTFAAAEYRRLLSVIFQDFAVYAEPVSDNIRFGDIATPATPDRITAAAKSAGATEFIARLPKGYDTQLTRMFEDGQDLSVGQWQRLALARALYPASRFLILDEPTSALDPRAEYELFQDFREKIGGRGALVISHRLSTVRQADYTYVLDHGRIVEHGRHDDLVAAGGKYAELFDMQAKHYR